MRMQSSSSSSVSAWKPSASIASLWQRQVFASWNMKKWVQYKWNIKYTKKSSVSYLLGVRTSLHVFSDGHAARALPFVGGWWRGRGGLRRGGRVPLGACGCLGFFTRLFSSSCGEVGPLAGHRKCLQAKAGQDVCVHVPAAPSVGRALLVNSIVLNEALQLQSDERTRQEKQTEITSDSDIWWEWCLFSIFVYKTTYCLKHLPNKLCEHVKKKTPTLINEHKEGSWPDVLL